MTFYMKNKTKIKKTKSNRKPVAFRNAPQCKKFNKNIDHLTDPLDIAVAWMAMAMSLERRMNNYFREVDKILVED